MPLLLDTFSWSDIFLPLITLVLGVVFTLAVTSVNHKRIHRDDIRKTVFDAVLNAKNFASEYWISKYDEKKGTELEGSYHFLKSIIPLSHGMMNKKQILEMETLLKELMLDLTGKDDITEEHHKISPDRVIKIHKSSGFFLNTYYSIYLKQTTIFTLTIYPRWIQIGNLYPLWIWIKNPDKNGGA